MTNATNTTNNIIFFAGCGGGYDIFGSLPMVYKESNLNKTILLSNISFTSTDTLKNLSKSNSTKVITLSQGCFEINPGSYADDVHYFPEYLLANQLDCPVYAICDFDTVDLIICAYASILEKNQIQTVDTFYLVDGGCDVLLTGKETELATFVEDMMNLKAITNIIENNIFPINNFYVCAIGLNVDCGHGVVELELVERLEQMRNDKIIIQEEYLSINQPHVKFYSDILAKCNIGQTLVHSFVHEALFGNYGFVVPNHPNIKITSNDKVNVSDLTKLFIICDGNKLAKSICYLDIITNTMESDQVENSVCLFVESNKL